MLWVSFDIELPQSRKFLRLEALDPRHPMKLLRLIGVAKRANEDGRVTDLDGEPLAAADLAMMLPGSTDEWEAFVRDALELGFLLEADGYLSIGDWPRWVKKPSEAPESVKDRVRRYRAARAHRECNDDVTTTKRPVTVGAQVADRPDVTAVTQHSTAQHSMSTAQQQQPPLPPQPGGGPAAAPVASLPELPDPASRGTRSTPPGSLETLRPLVGQAMQQLSILAAPDGPWWTEFSAWAAPGLTAGATLEDITDALAFGRDAARHKVAERPWPYAMTVAREELGNIARRNALRREWKASGCHGPEPRPYAWAPPDPQADPPDQLRRPASGRQRRAPPDLSPFNADPAAGGPRCSTR